MSRLRRFQIKTFEETGYMLQTFTIPKIKQDKIVRRVYTVANLLRVKEGLPKKTYPMLTRKGEWEEVC